MFTIGPTGLGGAERHSAAVPIPVSSPHRLCTATETRVVIQGDSNGRIPPSGLSLFWWNEATSKVQGAEEEEQLIEISYCYVRHP